MQTLDSIKRGDTFRYYATIKDENNTVISGAASSLKCQIRNSLDEKIATPAVTETSNAGEYQLLVEDTSTWDEGNLFMDIEHTDTDGSVVSSETLVIPVEKDVTYNG